MPHTHSTIAVIKNVFSGKPAGWVCLSLAIANKTIIAWLYGGLEGDKSLLLLFSKSFLATGILAEPVQIVETGITAYVYNPAVTSPLYSLLCTPVLWVTKSYLLAQFSVSIAGWCLFFTGLYKMVRLINTERWMANIFVLGTGFFLYPHELASAPKDTLAVAFLVWSICFTCRFVQAPRWQTTVWLAAAIAGFCLTKLLYVPLGAVLLATILLLTRKALRQYFVQYLFLISLLAGVALAAYMFLLLPAQQLAHTNPFVLPNDGTVITNGFYPQNLLYTYPFVTASFLNVNFLGVQIENSGLASYTQAMVLFKWVTAILLLLLAGAAYRNRESLLKPLAFSIAVSGAAMVLIVVGLSLRQKAFAYKSLESLWSWVMDARSFLWPVLALQLLLVVWVGSRRKPGLLPKIIFAFFIFECAHGLYFTIKKTIHASEVIATNLQMGAVKQVMVYLQARRVTDTSLSLITSDAPLRRYAILKNTAVASFSSVPVADLSWVKPGRRFLVVTHAADSAHLKKFAAGSLVQDTLIPPFILHRYAKKY